MSHSGMRTLTLTLTVTVIQDRYNGCYSEGKFTAWIGAVPDAVSGDDIECSQFWYDESPCAGKGETADAALADLYDRILELYPTARLREGLHE